MITRWATQVVEREVVFLSPETDGYLEDEGPSSDVSLPDREKSGLLEWVVYTLGAFFRDVSLRGLGLPTGPAFRHSKPLSDRDRAWLEAYWKYDIHI